MSLLTLNLDTIYLTDEQFYQLCQNNRELQFERTSKGALIIMSPVGGETANREAELIADLEICNWVIDPRLLKEVGDLISMHGCNWDG